MPKLVSKIYMNTEMMLRKLIQPSVNFDESNVELPHLITSNILFFVVLLFFSAGIFSAASFSVARFLAASLFLLLNAASTMVRVKAAKAAEPSSLLILIEDWGGNGSKLDTGGNSNSKLGILGNSTLGNSTLGNSILGNSIFFWVPEALFSWDCLSLLVNIDISLSRSFVPLNAFIWKF